MSKKAKATKPVDSADYKLDRFGHESGWLDTIDAMGVKRSVRASRCRDAQPSPASTPTPESI